MLSKKLLVFVFLIFSLFVGHIIFHHSGLSPKRDSNPEERKFRRSEYNLTEVNAKLSEKLKQATEKKVRANLFVNLTCNVLDHHFSNFFPF